MSNRGGSVPRNFNKPFKAAVSVKSIYDSDLVKNKMDDANVDAASVISQVADKVRFSSGAMLQTFDSSPVAHGANSAVFDTRSPKEALQRIGTFGHARLDALLDRK